MSAQPQKVNLRSLNITEEKRAQLQCALRGICPEVFSEGMVDFAQLQRVLGEWNEPGKERFGLNWHGKAACMKIIQQPSVATLKPVRDESVNFDDTDNLFMEGDNLEVLKLLQKSYFGKVKMIYLDPPYNTGKEFIYPDKYSETLDTYLEYTGQKDSKGRKFSTNTDTHGRYHSNWLNMMYPRLYLARNLLREDGVIFVSIDDNEVHNLRLLMNEIFGEENFVASFVWRKKYGGGKGSRFAVDLHEYILSFSKSIDIVKDFSLPRTKKQKEIFCSQDKYYQDRGGFYVRPLKSGLAKRKTLIYPIKCPDGSDLITQWICAKNTFEQLLKEGRIVFKKLKGGKYNVYKKFYAKDKGGDVLPESILYDIAYNQNGKEEMKYLFKIKEGREIIFENPKPSKLIKYFIQSSTNNNDLILDFFSGSGTTAHAVMALNAEDGGNRKCISVQLPELCDEKSEAHKAGYKTIADIGKERIRRAGQEIEKEHYTQSNIGGDNKLDIGFKVFKLAKSNFKVWAGDTENIENLNQQLIDHVDHVDTTSTPEDILYELLLKSGFPLTTKIEKRTLAGKTVFSIDEGRFLICLEKNLTQASIDAIADTNPQQVICLDDGFKDNDQLKVNAVQTFQSRARQEEREIVFRTV